MDNIDKYKRYMIFEEDQFYPIGGTGGCKKSFDELEHAIRWAKNSCNDYVEIFDRIEGIDIIWQDEL